MLFGGSVFGPNFFGELAVFSRSIFFAGFVAALSTFCSLHSAAALDDDNRAQVRYTEYNSFLKSQNWLELTALDTADVDVNITTYFHTGVQKNSFNRTVPGGQQLDVQIYSPAGGDNKVLGDEYGLVRVRILNLSNPRVSLTGRMAIYRQGITYSATNQTFDFAYALPLRVGETGRRYSFSNSVDPQNKGLPVYNWVSITNLDAAAQTYNYRRFSQAGALLANGSITLAPFQKCDIEGGHVSGAGVYLNEIIPANPGARYLQTSMRYAVNSFGSDGVTPVNYAYALTSFGKAPIDGVFLPATNRDVRSGESGRFIQTNWLEVANTTGGTVWVMGIVRSESGSQTASPITFDLGPHQQYHVNLSALLNSVNSDLGSVELHSMPSGAVVAQSVVYYRSPGTNRLMTAYNIQGERPTDLIQVGTYNLNLAMTNELVVYGSSGANKNTTISLFLNGMNISDTPITVRNYESFLFNLSDDDFNTDPDTLGPLTLSNINFGLMGYVIRSRKIQAANSSTPNDLEFAFPILVR